jgi:predicted Zn-ribbon and HTH transcriptional regulator
MAVKRDKLTYEKVKNFIEGDEGNGCKLISEEYKNNTTKLVVQCACGEFFNVPYEKFKNRNKKQCNKCSGISEYNIDIVKRFIEIESNCGCELLSRTYEGIYNYIEIQCQCGNIFKTRFADFKYNNKRQCNICGRKNTGEKLKLDYNYVKDFIEKNIGYKLITNEFNNCNQLLKLQCPKEHIFETTFVAFKRGCRCSFCSGHNRDTKQFNDEVKNLTNGEYELLSEYIKAVEKVKIKHLKCGCVFKMSPSSFLNGQRCPKCKGEKIRALKAFSYIEVKEYIESFNYFLISNKYKNSATKLKLKCPDGHIFEMRFSNFKRGIRCPECNKSQGEKKISEVLSKFNIPFKSEYTFKDLNGIGGGLLRYDFAIFKDLERNDLIKLIEFDGIFHYEKLYPNDGSEIVQIHDKIKNEYCENNNIKLIRIPYWNFDNIETILQKELNI